MGIARGQALQRVVEVAVSALALPTTCSASSSGTCGWPPPRLPARCAWTGPARVRQGVRCALRRAAQGLRAEFAWTVRIDVGTRRMLGTDRKAEP